MKNSDGQTRPAPVPIGFFGLWLLCLTVLVCPPCAQMCAGMSRFVLLTGLVGLYLAWPAHSSLRQGFGRFLGFVPLLVLALALDLKLGLHPGRGAWLAFSGVSLCMASIWLGAIDPRRSPPWQAWFVGGWYLLPLALGIWAHVVEGLFFAPGEAMIISPVGALWLGLPLFAAPILTAALLRLVLLLVVLGFVYLGVRRYRIRTGVGA